MIILAHCFIGIGILWSILALTEQQELYPYSSCWKLIYVVFINFGLWPACMILALLNRKKHNKQRGV